MFFDTAKVPHFWPIPKFRPSITCKNLLTKCEYFLKMLNASIKREQRNNVRFSLPSVRRVEKTQRYF